MAQQEQRKIVREILRARKENLIVCLQSDNEKKSDDYESDKGFINESHS